MRCQARASSTGERCKSQSAGKTVLHDGHKHRVCGTHINATDFTVGCPVKYDPNQPHLEGLNISAPRSNIYCEVCKRFLPEQEYNDHLH